MYLSHKCHAECEEVRGHLWELALSFHCIGPKDRIQIFRLGGKSLYSLTHLIGSPFPSKSAQNGALGLAQGCVESKASGPRFISYLCPSDDFSICFILGPMEYLHIGYGFHGLSVYRTHGTATEEREGDMTSHFTTKSQVCRAEDICSVP